MALSQGAPIHVIRCDDGAARSAPTGNDAPLLPDPVALRVRRVHRAMADLRRGTPVLLEASSPDAGHGLVLLPAETAGARGLAEFAALAGGPAVLLLSTARAAAVLRRPIGQGDAAVALLTSRGLLDPAMLHGLADPTARQILPADPVVAPAPANAGAALALTKLARLLPAVLAAPVRPAAGELAGNLALLAVPATDVLAYSATMATHLRLVAEAEVPMEDAPDARVMAFRGPDSGIEHLAILVGRPEDATFP